VGLALVTEIPVVAIIVENPCNEVLLLLRDQKPGLEFAGFWTLLGGRVEEGETTEMAAHRELLEETGLELPLSPWKTYKRRHQSRDLVIQQHVYVGQTDREIQDMHLGEGQALRYFSQQEIVSLPIAYGFDTLLEDFFHKKLIADSLPTPERRPTGGSLAIWENFSSD